MAVVDDAPASQRFTNKLRELLPACRLGVQLYGRAVSECPPIREPRLLPVLLLAGFKIRDNDVFEKALGYVREYY